MLSDKQKKVIDELNNSFLLNYSMSEILISNVIGDNEELLDKCLKNAKNYKKSLKEGDIFSEHKFRILSELYTALDFINEDFRGGRHKFHAEMKIKDNKCIFILKKGDKILDFEINLDGDKNIFEKKQEIKNITTDIYKLVSRGKIK